MSLLEFNTWGIWNNYDTYKHTQLCAYTVWQKIMPSCDIHKSSQVLNPEPAQIP